MPFFIWANYDIEEEKIQLTSLNYLSGYVYRAAGLALPEYDQILSGFQKKIPAMNSNSYYSSESGRFVMYKDAVGDEAAILNLYNQLEYNCLFDESGRNTILFPCSGD